MNPRLVAKAADTHLNDLQSDVEASSRLIDEVHRGGLRAAKSSRSALTTARLAQLAELKRGVKQQLKTLRSLRHDIRRLRDWCQRRFD